jgi:hypothetical protein
MLEMLILYLENFMCGLRKKIVGLMSVKYKDHRVKREKLE